MAAPYIGNPDYRGYLNYLSQNSTNPAVVNPTKALLNQVGNDGVIGSGAAQGSDLWNTNQKLYAQYQALNPQPRQSLPSIYGGGGGPAPVYAPRLDVGGIFAQANQAATGSQNALYNTYLNQYLQGEAAKQQQQQQQTDMNIKNLQDTYQQQIDANALTGQRTAEDTALKQANINTQNDQNQVDTGAAFEKARLAGATKLAQAGTLGSGAGNNVTAASINDRNTTEGRQNDAFQQQRDQAQLLKTRTFEDLAKSGELAQGAENKGINQENFNLQSFIKNQQIDEQNFRNQQNEARIKSINDETQRQARLAFNNYLAGIQNPAQYAAAIQTYGGSF